MSADVVVDRRAYLSIGKNNHQQSDYNHATDPEYMRLRKLADEAFAKKKQYSKQSQAAYKSGDHSGAYEYSEEAKKQTDIADRFNIEAAEYVFVQNNVDSDSNEIDLHGLFVKEAKWILQKRIAVGIRNGETNLEVVVGKGLHSQNGISKIKPAVEELCSEAQLRNYINPKNSGVLVIDLSGARIPSTWGAADFVTYSQNTKIQNNENQQHYQQQNQPQYYPQQQQQQPANNNSKGDLLSILLGVVCFCIQKNI